MEVRRVLLVDDDEHILEIAALALEDVAGLQVELCSTGAEAVERAAAWRPDVIVLDVMMPGMDGPAAFQAMRRKMGDACPPVVFLTAKGRPEATQRLLDLGAAGVLAKPFDPMTLGESLVHALDGA